MNNINKEQNTNKQLERLAAQRQLYSDAKKIFILHILLSVPVVLLWSIAIAWRQELKVYAAFYGVILTLADITLLIPLQKNIKEKAAKIQELFDCDVLKLEWRRFKIGIKPDGESISEACKNYLTQYKNYAALKSWYPSGLEKLPLQFARIICQRTNCWWDAKLRRRYANLMIAMGLTLTIIVFLIGLIGGMSLEKFILAVFIPLLPVFVLSIREYKENNECAQAVDSLKEHSEKLWEKTLAHRADRKELENDSRFLQDEIYDRRRNGPLVFDWIYRFLRTSFEEQMNVGAKELVKEAIKK